MKSSFSSPAKIFFVPFASIFLLVSSDPLYSALVFCVSSLLLVSMDRPEKSVLSLLGAFLSILVKNIFPDAVINCFKTISVIFLPFLWAKEISADDLLSLPLVGKTAFAKSLYMISEISSSFIPYMRSELAQTVFILKTFKLPKNSIFVKVPSLVAWSVMKIERRKINLYLSLKSRGFRDTDDLVFLGKPVFFSRKDILPYSALTLLLLVRFIT
ncbi:hypothetical protein JXA84_01790 [candidate division WOR-3 bacterium]|nr:hypothetical protein [candidate division WOR-3 bacterium]